MDDKPIEQVVEALMARLMKEIEVKLKEPEPDKSNLSQLQSEYHSIAHIYKKLKIDPASIRISDVPERHRNVFKLNIKGLYKDGKLEQDVEELKELSLKETNPRTIQLNIHAPESSLKGEEKSPVTDEPNSWPAKLFLLALVAMALFLYTFFVRHH